MKLRLRRRRSAAFSLVELIGVLAVISILATILTPPAIQQIDSMFAKQETGRLTTLAEGLRRAITRTCQIPDETGWTALVTSELGWPQEEVGNNIRQTPRVFLIDGAFKVGPAGTKPPYSQEIRGSIQPVNPRLMILSNLDPTKSIPIPSGVLDAALFEEIWNTTEMAAPASWTGRWQEAHAGDDLKIQRIHLGPLFHRVILSSPTTPRGFYAINDSDSSSVSSSGVSAYYLEGSLLRLFDSNDALVSHQIIHHSTSLVFENGSWNGKVFRGPRTEDDNLCLAHELFRHSAAPGSTQPEQFTVLLTQYFTAYSNWAAANFPTGQAQTFAALQEAQTSLQTGSLSLLQAEPSP